MTTNHLEKLDKALIRPGRVDMIVKFGLADAEMTTSIFRAIYAPYEGEAVIGKDSAAAKSDYIDPEEAQKQAEQAEKTRLETIERIGALAEQFAAKIPELEFSPAEIQGLLLKHKRDPEAVIDAADEWVVETRKEKKKKEIEDAEKRRDEEEKARKAEAKRIRKEERRKARKKRAKAKRRSNGESSGSDSSSDSDSDSDSEAANKERTKDEAKGDEGSKADAPKTDDKSEEKQTEDKKIDSEEKSKEKTEDETREGTKEGAKKDDAGDKKPKGTSDSGYDTPDQTS
ncbi:hypothetical protein NM208_g13505 [Fusarium decemcellulare]|uniref:Uncharacterized protein n=1 Tax=Fusarium decemcellulare TaxID=57161 RepID=A0ACC1RKY3_9HYPO|nr:hypothetical protein NM208_g13505 [Fusarium decemcellulare]